MKWKVNPNYTKGSKNIEAWHRNMETSGLDFVDSILVISAMIECWLLHVITIPEVQWCLAFFQFLKGPRTSEISIPYSGYSRIVVFYSNWIVSFVQVSSRLFTLHSLICWHNIFDLQSGALPPSLAYHAKSCHQSWTHNYNSIRLGYFLLPQECSAPSGSWCPC